MKRAGSLLAALGLVALAAWWTRGASSPEALTPGAVASAETGGSPGLEPASVDASPVQSVPAPAAQRAEVVAPPEPEVETPTMRVTVVGSDGRPIPGARVTASRSWSGRATGTAEADGDGVALVPLAVADSKVWLFTEAEGYFHTRGEHDASAEASVILPRGSTLSGRVLGPAGAPVPKARVSFWSERCWCDDHAAVTDGTGAFEGLEAYAGERLELSVEAPDHPLGTFVLQLEPGEAYRELRLEAGLRISGVVVDYDTGEPLESGTIQTPERGFHPLFLDHGAFDATFVSDPGGTVPMTLRAEGYCEALYVLDAATDGGERLTLPLPRLAYVEGRVTDTAGRPLAGAGVSVPPRAPELGPWPKGLAGALPYVQLRAPHVPTRVAEDGSFRTGGHVPWSRAVQLRFWHVDCEPRQVGVDLAGPGVTELDVELEPLPPKGSLTVRGRVTIGGEVVPGTVGWIQGPRHGSAALAEDGSYEATGLRSGDVKLMPSLEGDGYALFEITRKHSVVVHLSGADVERDIDVPVVLGRVAGHVRRDDGTGVPGESVWLRSETVGIVSSSKATDAQGAFEFRVPEDCSYELALERHPVGPRVTHVRPGAPDVVLVLHEPGRLRVHASDRRTGAEVSRIDVLAREVGGAGAGLWLQSSRMDSPDELEASPGLFDIAVHAAAAGYLPCEVRRVTIASGELTEVSVELDRGRDLVVHLDAEALARGRPAILLIEAEASLETLSGVSRFLVSQDRQVALASGARVRGLAPGDYRFVSTVGSWRFEPARVHVGPGEVTEVELSWYPAD